jgi:hypothetical protein
MHAARHEALQDAMAFFTLAVVTINCVFLGRLLHNQKRQREREDAAKPPRLAETVGDAERPKRAASGRR